MNLELNVKRDKIVKKIAIIFLVLIVILTFCSKSIYNLLIPEVEVVVSTYGNLENNYYYQGTVDYKDKGTVFSRGNWIIEEVYVKGVEIVKAGQPLAKINQDELILNEKKLWNEILQIEDSIREIRKLEKIDYNELQIKLNELEIAKIEYNNLRNGLNENGEILSPVAGSLVEVNCEEGVQVLENTKLFEIIEENSEIIISWTGDIIESSNINAGKRVNIDIANKGETIYLEGEIYKKVIQGEDNLNRFYASINEKDLKGAVLQKNQRVNISTSEKTEDYSYLVPKQCLIEKDNKEYINIILEKEGAFGKEYYIEELPVDVIAEDNFYVALKELPQYVRKIVISSSSSISNGEKVRVRM